MQDNLIDKIIRGKVYAIIPARAGSKGIIDKNIRDLNGFPLIAYTIAEAMLCHCIDRVIVSTDSEEYATIAGQYGAEVPFIRPPEYATDESQDIDFMKHAIVWMANNEDSVPEYWVHLRTTCPYRDPDVIDESIKLIRMHSESSSLLSVCVPQRALIPYKWLILKGDYLASIFFDDADDSNRPRQTYPTSYARSIYSDIYKSETIISRDRLYGEKILPFHTDETYDIDTIKDFEAARKEINLDSRVLEYLRAHRGNK